MSSAGGRHKVTGYDGRHALRVRSVRVAQSVRDAVTRRYTHPLTTEGDCMTHGFSCPWTAAQYEKKTGRR